jgi:hypothetical protein
MRTTLVSIPTDTLPRDDPVTIAAAEWPEQGNPG